MKKETVIIHDDEKYSYMGSIVPPIAQSAIFTFKDYEMLGKYVYKTDDEFIYGYTRGGNPTVRLLEEKLANLGCGEDCVCVSSGEAAIVLTLLYCLTSQDHMICIASAYSSARKFIDEVLVKKMDIEVTYVDGRNTNDFIVNIKENTKLIYLESPSSAIFQLQDIQEICKVAKKNKIKVAIDNTCATMLNQKPIKMGVDLEIHSLSKYISGHNDVIAGAIIGRKEDIDHLREKEAVFIGTTVSPFDAWLALRGLRTLPIRLKEQEKNASYLAKHLEKMNKIEKVNYIGLSTFEQKDLYYKQMTGTTGLFSFSISTTKNQVKQFVEKLTLFKVGISWGGVESMIYISNMNKPHYIEADENETISVLFRVSVGLENPVDLLTDLKCALEYL